VEPDCIRAADLGGAHPDAGTDDPGHTRDAHMKDWLVITLLTAAIELTRFIRILRREQASETVMWKHGGDW